MGIKNNIPEYDPQTGELNHLYESLTGKKNPMKPDPIVNNIDLSYQNLLRDILENGVEKKDRTGTGTISVFGRQIRHKMSEGYPLLTTKKMAFKTMVTELLWFLKGETNIKYLVDNNCHIWDGDCYQAYLKEWKPENRNIGGDYIDQKLGDERPLPKDVFIHLIKTDDEFAEKWGDLGPIYGKQWRNWEVNEPKEILRTENVTWPYEPNPHTYQQRVGPFKITQIDQIANLISDLKTNPDSRRLMVTAWNPADVNEAVLPPCHYGFQVYTRELTWEEQVQWVMKNTDVEWENLYIVEEIAKDTTPKRAISLMFNMRSVDTFLGLPFNIASYALLLEIIAKEVNMIPDELIGNLGDVHLYSNHIKQAKEQLTRTPMKLPKLDIHPGILDYELDKLEVDMFKLVDYQSHPTIKAPLSN